MIADYVFRSKYAKFNKELMRRECWSEATNRMMSMHISQFPEVSEELEECRAAMVKKRITGSQRALQFGGKPALSKNMRIYNCVSSYADRPRFFGELLWLLMCGCGVGYSLQKHHVNSLPQVQETGYPYTHIIDDNIESWADAVNALFEAYFYGSSLPYFKYSEIRPKGSPVSVGGQSSGPEPLRKALDHLDDILRSRIGEKLSTVDVFDCCCHIADLAAIRRAATIATFDIDDEDMLNAKVGNWFEDNPQRGRANISAVVTERTSRESFDRVFKSTKEFGEPGLIFLESKEHTVNPCVEILMCPTLVSKDGNVVENYTKDLLDFENREFWIRKGYTFESGWQACNLSTINASKLKTPEDLREAARLAATLGTVQSAYTNTGYLGDVSKRIMEREHLLGVSICGILDNPSICLNPTALRNAAAAANLANSVVAQKLGISPASRITCVKPEGTTSLVLGTSSGIHPHHAKRYIRRVNANQSEPIFQKFFSANPHAVEDSLWGADKVVAFALEAPQGALTRSDISAIEFMEMSKTVYENWVVPGTSKDRLEGGTHNVSITVTVMDEEWGYVQDYLWKNKGKFCGVSFLSFSGDYTYPQAPYQEVSPPSDQSSSAEIKAWALWNDLKKKTQSVNYNDVVETTDTTNPTLEPACSGGQCELI